MTKGMPLVLVPGHLCGAWLYSKQIESLRGRAVEIAETRRDDSIVAMAERLLNDAPERFAIAGLSMGAMVAMEVLAAAPERVSGACLMATDPTTARAKECEWRADLISAGLAGYVETFVGRFFRHDAGAEARLGPSVRREMARFDVAVAQAQARALDGRREMAPLIASYAGPVEIVAGAEDRVCPAALHRPLAAALSGAHLTEVPGCGHLVTLEAPEAASEALARMFERIRE